MRAAARRCQGDAGGTGGGATATVAPLSSTPTPVSAGGTGGGATATVAPLSSTPTPGSAGGTGGVPTATVDPSSLTPVPDETWESVIWVSAAVGASSTLRIAGARPA